MTPTTRSDVTTAFSCREAIHSRSGNPCSQLRYKIVRLRRVQHLRRVSVQAMLGESGTLAATGTVRLPGSSRIVRFRQTKKSAPPSTKVTLRLRLRRKGARIAARYLRRHRKTTARVKLIGRDEAGNSTTAARTFRVTR